MIGIKIVCVVRGVITSLPFSLLPRVNIKTRFYPAKPSTRVQPSQAKAWLG